MKRINRERFLTVAVLFLLFINVGVVIYLVVEQRLGPPRPELFDVLVRELDMSGEQQRNYFILRDDHRFQMERLNDQYTKTLENYLKLIARDSSIFMKNQLEEKMASIEKEKAAITLRHFQQVREICSSDQKEKFDRLIPEIARYMSRPRPIRPLRRE